MKTRHLITLVGITALLSGCIPSVNPFYTPKDVVFDSRLLGEWETKDSGSDSQLWKFEKGTDQNYQLTITEKGGKKGGFHARLFKLKHETFLDFIPSDCKYATNQADLVGFSMFPGHLLARITQVGPELKLAMTNFDWLEKLLKRNPKALTHHTEDQCMILTDGTRDLQRFVLKHLGEGELFDQPVVMVRKSEPTTQ
jgi:hypothetical protein